MSVTRQVVERVFREESGRILATLIRVLGEFDLAQEVMQEAFAVALQRWPVDGVPDNPGAWITTSTGPWKSGSGRSFPIRACSARTCPRIRAWTTR